MQSKMHKPKSMGFMNTQPLNNNYTEFAKQANYNNMVYPDKHSALSLQIGGGTYNHTRGKAKFAQKAKNRSGSNKMFQNANNHDNFQGRYSKYHQIYANNANHPIKAVQK